MVSKQVIESTDFDDLFGVMADLLIELGPQETILKVAGDSQALLGRDLAVGEAFASLISHRDLPVYSAIKTKLTSFRKAGPVPIHMVDKAGEKVTVDLFAVSIRRQGEMYIQLMLRPFKGSVALPYFSDMNAASGADNTLGVDSFGFSSSDFDQLVSRLEDYAASMKSTPQQALMKISGMDDAGDESLQQRLVSLMRLLSESATLSKRTREAEDAKPQADVQDALEDALSINSKRVMPEVVTGDDGLTEAENIKAAAYSWQKAAKGGKASTMIGATGDYEKTLQRSKQQLRAFKNIVTQEYFDVALQPIVKIDDGQLHHYEALCRFDPRFYKGSPYPFMCFAEEIGVIHEFDMVMTLKVIQLLRRMRRVGYNLSIAVNLSGKSIQNPLFLRSFFKLLEDCDDMRHTLTFELTESSQIDDLKTTNAILSRIRSYGHKVCLDDFGAGAAGIQYLKALKVDYVKIDGIYIRQGIEKADNRSMLRSMAELCSKMGIETVGECVEDETQLAFLKDIGVTYAQGWYYGKPLPVDEAVSEFEGRDFN